MNLKNIASLTQGQTLQTLNPFDDLNVVVWAHSSSDSDTWANTVRYTDASNSLWPHTDPGNSKAFQPSLDWRL